MMRNSILVNGISPAWETYASALSRGSVSPLVLPIAFDALIRSLTNQRVPMITVESDYGAIPLDTTVPRRMDIATSGSFTTVERLLTLVTFCNYRICASIVISFILFDRGDHRRRLRRIVTNLLSLGACAFKWIKCRIEGSLSAFKTDCPPPVSTATNKTKTMKSLGIGIQHWRSSKICRWSINIVLPLYILRTSKDHTVLFSWEWSGDCVCLVLTSIRPVDLRKSILHVVWYINWDNN